ncbi:MAG: CocE/NonD family hydrolase, partial [Chroococcales cyanobacterium]
MNNHRRRCKPRWYRPLLFTLALIFSLIFGLEPGGETWAKVSPLSGVVGVENLDSSRYPTNQALYVTMGDGVKIAIDIWLPKQLNPDEKIPTLMRMDRYWRSVGIMGYFPQFDPNYSEAQLANNAGYALVLVDARGTGSSFGTQIYPWSPDEIEDYGEIVDWII